MTPTSKRRTRWALGVVASVLGVGALVAACGRAAGPNRPPRESLLEKSQGRAAYSSPAVWRYHPRSEAPLLARLQLDNGDQLFAGERGERWLFVKKGSTVRAAARLAPETLIAILRLDDGGFLFVGQSGTGYEARDPLGPFVRSSAPVDKLARVSAAGTSVIGVTREGQLVQSPDAGATWKPVGPTDQRFVDAMLADPKRGLALSVPEAMWETKDGGSTWSKLSVPTSGAIALGWDDQAGVSVQTALTWLSWNPTGTTPFKPLGRTPAKGRFRLASKPARGPDANALAEGRAIVLDGKYLEVAREAASGSSSSRWKPAADPWVLWRGQMDGTLKSRPFEAAQGCQSVRLAGFGRWLYFACAKSGGGVNQTVTISRSADAGKSFEADPYSLEARLGDLELAVGSGGDLVVTGVCAPHTSSRGCLPYGIFHRRLAPVDAGTEGGKDAKAPKPDADAGKADAKSKDGGVEAPEHELAPSAAPALKGSALALAFSPDGRTAFAVGRRTKGNSLAVFVSRDGGESFEAHDIDQLEGSFDDNSSSDDRWARPPSSQSLNVASMVPAEDGTVAIVLKGGGPPLIVVVDEEGRVVSFARAPGEATTAGAVGTRALAFSETLRTAWESLDGGATWDPIGRLPAATCPQNGVPCNATVLCHLGGCVVGSELSRVGWHGQGDDEQGVLPPSEFGLGDLFDRKVGAPFSCTLDEKPWQVLEGVGQAPDASRAAMGKAAWYALAQDDRKATVTTYHATGGARPKVETVQLLAPVTKPADYAYRSSLQAEGAAAIRYPAPDGTTTIKNVEVVWDNLLEGKLHRAKLADGGPVGINDYQNTGYGAKSALTNFLSIGTGGIYLRIHYSPGEAQPTLFLDGRSVTTVPEVRWPSSSLSRHVELIHVGNAHVPVGVLGNGAATIRARRDGADWAFDALATGLVDPSRFGLAQEGGLAYTAHLGGSLHVTLWDPDGTRHSSWLYPYRASGDVADAPIPLPMLADAGDKPNRCGSVTKTDTPRTIVPMQAGTRHAVIVTDTTEPMRVLLTGAAVMHGTPSEPCVAAFDAEVVNIDPNLGTPEQERAIIVMDDLEHSWIFRTSYSPMGEARIETRVMSCRYDPTLEPPPEIFSLPGTKVKRAR